MEKITMYKCSFCGKIYEREEDCIHHEEGKCTKNNRWYKINEKWENGSSLGEINDEFHIIKVLPGELRTATKETIIRCYDPKQEHYVEGTIQKFVSTYIVIISCDSAWKRECHRGYADFKHMQCIEK